MYCDVRSDRCRVPFPVRPGGTRTTSRRLQVRKETYSRYSSNSSSPHELARPACVTVRCRSGIFRPCRFSLRAEQHPRRQNGWDSVTNSPKMGLRARHAYRVGSASRRMPESQQVWPVGVDSAVGYSAPNQTEPAGSGPPKARHLPAVKCERGRQPRTPSSSGLVKRLPECWHDRVRGRQIE